MYQVKHVNSLAQLVASLVLYLCLQPLSRAARAYRMFPVLVVNDTLCVHNTFISCLHVQPSIYTEAVDLYIGDQLLTDSPWAARYNTWLLIKLTPKGVV
jgi:hypothetical protein